MANIGDKYIIEIESIYGQSITVPAGTNPEDVKPPKGPGKLYRIKGFNSLIFDENGLSKLKKYKEPSEQPITVGDEVICDGNRFVVTKFHGEYASGIDSSGEAYAGKIRNFKRTGRRCDCLIATLNYMASEE